MTRCALVVLLTFGAMGTMAVGCAGPTAESKRVAECTIPQRPWEASDEGGAFDRARSAELNAKLQEIAAADQRDAQAGQPIGARLTALGKETASTKIVAKQTVQLGERLRQLECAVQRGTYARTPQTTDRLFSQIEGELDREQIALGASKDRTATR
jgi:hypothetical protein